MREINTRGGSTPDASKCLLFTQSIKRGLVGRGDYLSNRIDARSAMNKGFGRVFSSVICDLFSLERLHRR